MENIRSSLSNPVAARISHYEAAQRRLAAWGALMAAIYAVYLIAFPLVPTIQTSAALLDIEKLLSDGRRWFAPIYVLGLLVLFYAFWQVLRTVQELSQKDAQGAARLRSRVLIIGLACSVILLGLYPITAIDVVLYVVRGRLWALHGVNPLIALPANFPHDPFAALAGEYSKQASPYGPLWELIAQAPLRLGFVDLAGGVLGMKIISLLAYAFTGILIGWAAQQDEARSPVSNVTALAFFALNPLVLLEAIGNGHNDMLMLAMWTLGLVLWQRGRWAWAGLALTAGALIKSTGLILLPLYGVAALAGAPTWRARLQRALVMLAMCGGTALLAYRVMGPFPDVLQGVLHATLGRVGYTPSYMIYRMMLYAGVRDTDLLRMPPQAGNWLFGLCMLVLLVQLARRKMTLIRAGFAAMLAELLLGTTFRIWYPLWLVPFAALALSSTRAWSTLLFGLTAELSIVNYYIVWRWVVNPLGADATGVLKANWNFWTVMGVLTVPWAFGLPLLAPFFSRRWPLAAPGMSHEMIEDLPE